LYFQKESKYLGETGIFSYKKKSGSQFWKGLMEVRGDVTRGVSYIIGNGKKIRFWRATWLGVSSEFSLSKSI
jgi:hypothetical protein